MIKDLYAAKTELSIAKTTLSNLHLRGASSAHSISKSLRNIEDSLKLIDNVLKELNRAEDDGK